jgi:hypothetical protein
MQTHAVTHCSDVVRCSDLFASFIVTRARRLQTGNYLTTGHYVTTSLSEETAAHSPGQHPGNAERRCASRGVVAGSHEKRQRSAHAPRQGTAAPRTKHGTSNALTGLVRTCDGVPDEGLREPSPTSLATSHSHADGCCSRRESFVSAHLLARLRPTRWRTGPRQPTGVAPE